ncbi:MAG: hypothetical protein ACREJN_06730 [Nitrospiraceae bacterium]
MLGGLYERMPARNFVMGMLEQLPNRVAALEVNGVTWSDWGRAEQIAESLGRAGKTPVYPAEPVAVA